MTTYYKWLNDDGTTPQGYGLYALARRANDGTYTPGAWQRRITGALEPCLNGYHVMRADQLVYWIGPTLHRVEVDESDMVVTADKCVVRRVRVVEPVTAWNETTARLFAADCAERVLPIFEARYPNDDRPRRAIEAARAFARGEIGGETLHARARAAYAAAADARAAHARAARAAYAAAHAAADARAAHARAARAAYAAADARASAASAASAAEYQWQSQRLIEILGIEP